MILFWIKVDFKEILTFSEAYFTPISHVTILASSICRMYMISWPHKALFWLIYDLRDKTAIPGDNHICYLRTCHTSYILNLTS